MIPARNIKRFVQKSLKQPGYALKVFYKRLKAFLAYELFSGYSAYPEAITLFLTYRCNLRCKMCGQWGDAGVTKKAPASERNEELPIAEYKKLIDEISAFGPNITLFGGEPLLYKDCMSLIAYIKSKHMHCCMITNATLLSSYAEKLVDYDLNELNISLDGPREKHDDIRGVAGMFDKIKAGIDAVQEVKSKKGKTLPLINLEFTITQYNYQNIPEMTEVAKSLKADSLNFHHLVFINQDMFDQHIRVFYPIFESSSDDWKGFLLEGVEKINIDILNEYLAKVKSGRYSFLVNVYPNLTPGETKIYYTAPGIIPQGYKQRCLSPWMVAYIFPDGSVRPCLNFSFSPGNIEKQGFKKIWQNDKYVNFRGVLKKRGIFPVCSRCTELFRY